MATEGGVRVAWIGVRIRIRDDSFTVQSVTVLIGSRRLSRASPLGRSAAEEIGVTVINPFITRPTELVDFLAYLTWFDRRAPLN